MGKSKQIAVPLIREGHRWLTQAKQDYRVSVVILHSNKTNSFNWVCYTCHQASEKALVGATFATNAKNVTKTHSLTRLAEPFSMQLRNKAVKLEHLVSPYNEMRYPGTGIPSEIYDKTTASQCVILTRDIITLAEKYVSG